MKDFRFYADYGSAKDKRKRAPPQNCIAVIISSRPYYVRQGRDEWEALSAVFDHADSDTAITSISGEYLAKKCRRIPEATARTIHPRLFARLDADDG